MEFFLGALVFGVGALVGAAINSMQTKKEEDN